MAINQMFRLKVARIGIGLMITVFGANQLAAETKVPNEFTSGTPAKASEVNENFSDLSSKIEAISKPESSYSVLSTETLYNGLVRTKLYAYEQHSSSRQVIFHDTYSGLSSESAVEVRQMGVVINALGKFQQDIYYRDNFNRAYSNPVGPSFAHVTCPDGSPIERAITDVVFNYSFVNLAGSFVLSSRGGANSGVFRGCIDELGVGKEYYYLEGRGNGVYSCVSRVAFYGSDSGGFTSDTAPSQSWRNDNGMGFAPYVTVNFFDRTSNGKWGTYYLEIDAPAGCITLTGPAPVQPTPAPDEDSPDADPPTPAAPVTPVPSDTTTTTTSE
jgi:hypothetical protein